MANNTSKNMTTEEMTNAILDGLENVTEELKEITNNALNEIFSDTFSYYKNK